MANIRYIKQPDNYGCGPTAILNTLKWAGYRVTLKKHYRALVIKCRSKDPDGNEFSGTTVYDFENVLKYVGQKIFDIKFLLRPKIKRIKKELKKGNAVILLHLNPDHTSHYTLIISNEGNNFVAVNAFKDSSTVATVSLEILEFWTKKSKYMPLAWVITKKSWYNK